MRVLAPLFGIVASTVTIFAAVVRLWWSKPRFRGYDNPKPGAPHGEMDSHFDEPRAPSWLRSFARTWLYLVAFLVTVAVVVVITTVIVRIINLSS
jgi:hypothetical protein